MKEVIVGKGSALLGKSIGKGGEGEVFTLNGYSDQAVKIYSTGLRAKREDKVRAMVREDLAAKTNIVAYPSEVVSDAKGNFLGFLMRLVSGYRPIHELYSPKSRKRHFPKANYRFIIRAAINVARAVANVHQSGGVIGDFNHSGVLVSQDATVALIDADSFQFQFGKKTYPCVVGVPDFTPPELHGTNLGNVKRTYEHDNFSLAVAIFHLLFMGRHPYAGRFAGPDISIGEAIGQNRFAFSLARKSETKTSPPPGALTLDLFPRHIQDAFEQSFGLTPKVRPSAADWIGILTTLERSLRKCSNVETHYNPGSVKQCVWCNLANKHNFDMFPGLPTSFPNLQSDSRKIDQAIREINAFVFPTVVDILPAVSIPANQASSALKKAKKENRPSFMGLFMILAAITGLLNSSSIWIIWLGLAYWGWSKLKAQEVNTQPFLDSFRNADMQVQHALDELIRISGLAEVVRVRRDLDSAIKDYHGIADSFDRELRKFESTRESRQRSSYLDKYPIRQANISGIGPVKTATLISFGIETAADVNNHDVLAVPGFGKVMTSKLLKWRKDLESKFRFNQRKSAQEVADEQALTAKFATQKSKLEATIQNGADTLRAAKAQLKELPAKAHANQTLIQALKEREQAAQDLRLLKLLVPSSAVTWKVKLPKPTTNRSHHSSQPPARPSMSSQPARKSRPSPRSQPKRKRQAPRKSSTTTKAQSPNCPKCGSSMVDRTGQFGAFWGCSRFPRCKGNRSK